LTIWRIVLKVQVLSDLHLEFHSDEGERFLMELDPEGVDVLVVAGDLCTRSIHKEALPFLAMRYPHVVFVLGNHDYYGCTFLQVHSNLEAICAEHENLHWLHNEAVEIEGQRFLGTPLWFRHDPLNAVYAAGLNDFRQILDFRTWVYPENHKALAFLESNVREGDFVVTHHLPSFQSNARYRGSQLTRFFVCDVESLIVQERPAVWAHGHTHETCNYELYETRVVCNPFGYLGVEQNPHYQPRMIVEI
jgi:predicted phosphodiesterase